MRDINVGILGVGIYIPEKRMSAAEISKATNGYWSEEAVINKLGINEKSIPGVNDGTQEMGVKAAFSAMNDAKIAAREIDVILCMGEEWKEFPLTTSALYIQDKIGAVNAWGIDLQNRCCTTISALKIAKDIMIADSDISTVLIVGGYRNGDFIDYLDKNMSMMYNLSAGAGALILRRNYNRNIILGTHIIADGSLSRDAGVEIGGINQKINSDNLDYAYKSLRLMNPVKMKKRLNEVSMPNWFLCIDKALEKSGFKRQDIDYVAVLHFKKSMHKFLLNELGVSDEQTTYLNYYGHMGQIDQILSLKLGLESQKIKDGSVVLMIAAGIGYVWAASVVKWGAD